MGIVLVHEVQDETDIGAFLFRSQATANALTVCHFRLAATRKSNKTNRRHVNTNIENVGANQNRDLSVPNFLSARLRAS